jgi:hypothetical protein
MCDCEVKDINGVPVMQKKSFLILMFFLFLMGLICFFAGFASIYMALRSIIRHNLVCTSISGVKITSMYSGTALGTQTALTFGVSMILLSIISILESCTALLMRKRKGQKLLKFINIWWPYRIMFFTIITGLFAIYFCFFSCVI